MTPTFDRLRDEQSSLSILPSTCRNCGAAREYIPFDMRWLEMNLAAGSAVAVARILLDRTSDIQRGNSIAQWLRQVSHEIDALVCAEQIRRTREACEVQMRELKARKVARAREEALSDALSAFIEEEQG